MNLICTFSILYQRMHSFKPHAFVSCSLSCVLTLLKVDKKIPFRISLYRLISKMPEKISQEGISGHLTSESRSRLLFLESWCLCQSKQTPHAKETWVCTKHSNDPLVSLTPRSLSDHRKSFPSKSLVEIWKIEPSKTKSPDTNQLRQSWLRPT